MRLATAAMGTRFELVLDGAAEARHRGAAEAAMEEIETCHRRLSRFAPDSLLAHLGRIPPGEWLPLDRGTFALLDDARRVWRLSGGAFDPATPPGGLAFLELDEGGVALRWARPGITLDLGGIAKGHALDLAAAHLRDAGVGAALLHGGTSSVVALGTPEGAAGWGVAIGPGAQAEVITLADEALSVSAAWEGNPHPTRDLRSGRAVLPPRRVVIVGPSARLADAWSTAALVLGERPASLDSGWRCRFG